MLNVVTLYVANKPFKLSVVMLSVFMLNGVVLRVVAPLESLFSGCFETVTWAVMNKPIYITPQQVRYLHGGKLWRWPLSDTSILA
jgi:hypothetical protein